MASLAQLQSRTRIARRWSGHSIRMMIASTPRAQAVAAIDSSEKICVRWHRPGLCGDGGAIDVEPTCAGEFREEDYRFGLELTVSPR